MTPHRPVSELSERELLLLLNDKFEDHLKDHDRLISNVKWFVGIVVPVVSGMIAAAMSLIPGVIQHFTR
jgi:hypothetical protein